MSATTREHILTCGGRIIHHKGFTATGLQEILQAAEVPKGSFYFYFKSKEEFGLALVDFYQDWFAEQVRPILKDESRSPLVRLAEFFLWFRRYFAQEGFIKGCPIGNLIQELGDVNPAFREKLNTSLDGLTRFIARLLEEAREQGPAAGPPGTGGNGAVYHSRLAGVFDPDEGRCRPRTAGHVPHHDL
jgi:TetR/AcrR family transcriptional regulator, transcriptional repressor for nem operon